MSISPSEPSPSSAADAWSALVAGQVEHEARIEAALDWADVCESMGEFQLALDCLDRAAALSGGLSPACCAQRARCARELERAEP
jgi:MoxR-like ATPase